MTSYAGRLVQRLGCPTHTFCKQILNDPKALHRDIDIYGSASLEEKLRPYGLRGYISLADQLKWARCQEAFYHQSPDVLNINILGTKKTKYGQQYCPVCLKENGYFKWTWRLAAIPLCTIHGILLRDRCEHCDSPIVNAKTSALLGGLDSCAFCWKSLCRPTENVNSETVHFIKAIESGIRTGWFSHNNFELYTPLFLKGFWRIVYAFYGTKGRDKNTWKRVCEFYGTRFFELSESRRSNSFKDEICNNRLLVIEVIRKMLREWPDEMIAACSESGVTGLVLDLSRSGKPYWLQQVAESDLNLDWYKLSTIEFESALIYMSKRKLLINKATLARLLGFDISMKLNTEQRCLYNRYKSDE